MQNLSESKSNQMDEPSTSSGSLDIFVAWDKFIKELAQKGGSGYAIKNGTFGFVRCLSFCDTCGEKLANIHFTYFNMTFDDGTIHDALKHGKVNPIQKNFLESKPIPQLIPKTIPNPELA